MSWLRRLWRAFVSVRPTPTRRARPYGERTMARRRLDRIQQRLDADLLRFSEEMEDGWKRRKP